MRLRLAAVFLLSSALFIQAQQPPSPTASAKTASSGSAKTGTAASPQSPALATTKPTTSQVLKLLQLLRVRDDLQATLDSMKQEMKAEAEHVFRDKVDHPSEAQLKSVNGIVDDAFAELAIDDLIKDLVPIYQRHLTRDDVQALVTFYSSPPGQKILRVQPVIIRESMQSAGSAQQKRMETMLAKVELRMQQLIDQETKPEPEKK